MLLRLTLNIKLQLEKQNLKDLLMLDNGHVPGEGQALVRQGVQTFSLYSNA